jgi:hypothetical protein
MPVCFRFCLIFILSLLVACHPDRERTIVRYQPGLDYVLNSGFWSRFFRSEPQLYVVPKLSDNARTLLEREQRLASVILNGHARLQDRPEYLLLSESLDELKSAVPGLSIRTGSAARSNSSGSRSEAYASDSGSYSYVRRSASSYASAFQRVHRTSSPELARSVENAVRNASLENLHQRIDALNLLISTWSRKSEVMSYNGVSGVMREANLGYIASLKEYRDDYRGLYQELKEIEVLLAQAASRAQAMQTEWQAFETTELVELDRYVRNFTAAVIQPTMQGRYYMPEYRGFIIVACEVGERTLYFNLSELDGSTHPLRLVE